MRLENRVAVVTGGSRGIGRAIAIRFAEEGADIVVNYSKSRREAEETVESISNLERRAVALKADVSNPAEVEDMAEKVIKEFGRVDILVNNAGVLSPPRPLEEVSYEEWMRTVDINLNGVFFCTKNFGKYMIKQKKGCIINIASSAGVAPLNLGGAYSVTKAGVIMLTRQAAIEWARYGVRVNAICPGPIKTQMILSRYTPEELRARIETLPLGRIGEPREVAELALFLASDESEYITGQAIGIDGGLTQSTYWVMKRLMKKLLEK